MAKLGPRDMPEPLMLALAEAARALNYEAIALDSLAASESFAPLDYPAPPEPLREVIEAVRHQFHLGRREPAQRLMDDFMAGQVGPALLSAYREILTYTEAQNARRLSGACWTYHTLLPRAVEGDTQLAASLETLRSRVCDGYCVVELSVERGWADERTRQLGLLPTLWRNL